jgi:4-alpha-glucanotransferase
VPDSTLAAVLEALGAWGRASEASEAEGWKPSRGGTGAAQAPVRRGGLGGIVPPASRQYGFNVQLYSLRSRDSWGHGDLRDLADFAVWAARDLGADFVLINPVHAAEPVSPITASPYTPVSRRFLSPLYLRIEDIPEFSFTERRVAGPPNAPLIDRDAVWSAKRTALELVYRVPMSPDRQRSFDAFRGRQGRQLTSWGTWCAIAEVNGSDYRDWPARLQDPESIGVAEFREEHSDRVAFHEWLQWLVSTQAADAQRAALDAGMSIGIIHDLAVGSHPGGFDAWAGQGVLVRGLTVGAPPDGFNQLGQDWGLPPWHPGNLAAAGYRPMTDLFAAAVRDSGGLRVDHVMGLSRLWVIPSGVKASHGTYLRYDRNATAGALASATAEAGALAIGEDLGTVERGLRKFLSGRHILGTSMLWFEYGSDGAPLSPGQWRRDSLATVSTHDMPPAAAFRTAEYVAERARLGLLTQPESVERADALRAVASWTDALVREGLLPAGSHPGETEFIAALYGYIALSRAVLIGISLADAVGMHRAQNIPGTTGEYPNWRVPLCDADGVPLLLEDLPGSAALRTVASGVGRTLARGV